MSRLLSPFKSPISVLSQLREWSSRKCHHRDDGGTSAVHATAASPDTLDNHRLKSSDGVVLEDLNSYCTPQPSRYFALTTPDSGIHVSCTTHAVHSPSDPTVRFKVSSPIPINNGTPTPQQCSKVTHSQKGKQKETALYAIAHDVSPEYHIHSPFSPHNGIYIRRTSTISTASAVAASVATTTTSLPSETSFSVRSEDGGSCCLKLSDLDSPDCLSPSLSPGWSRALPDSVKIQIMQHSDSPYKWLPATHLCDPNKHQNSCTSVDSSVKGQFEYCNQRFVSHTPLDKTLVRF